MKKQLLLTVTFSSLFFSGLSQYKNLVMEGAGIRGIAYTGAIKVLEEKQVMDLVERVAGTSVGAIVSALLCVGYSADELKEIMFNLKIQTFNDGRGFFIGGQRRLRKNFGWYRGEEIETWIADLIEKKSGDRNLSFSALHRLHLANKQYRDLFVTATNLTKQKAESFSWLSHPEMKISTAVRISISVPLYFTAVFINENGEMERKPKPSGNYQVYVDGGILANYPLKIFDTLNVTGAAEPSGDNKTLGIKVERPEQLDWYKTSGLIAPFKINNFRQYISSLYNIIIENLNRNQPYEIEKLKTIYINTNNISPKVRKITRAQKQMLYENGMQGAANFFK